ncbi:hypothetical protein ETF27_09340 [Prevotella brunnea]|uniref:Uncharacterized protein n=1 Tax=Prevotella brunnea TaxID=2508867 RepID=A0A5C8GCP0_9BACT|nr:hypothetical protein [Prevotella brunnea]MDR0186411.1 hypothetical protein [Prevotella brunnea]TXJ59705.1 hypothetical protein ETF27_09340 [Prevotella brunnea]
MEEKTKATLEPKKGYGIFKVGAPIDDYLQLPHRKEVYEEESFRMDCYVFPVEKVELWCESGIVNTIFPWESCFYAGTNLLGMNFDEFLSMTGAKPNDEDTIYVPQNNGKGQNQHVYDFDGMGLQLWVWRGKIRTVLIYARP